jgi:thiopurine S-methyltransferase
MHTEFWEARWQSREIGFHYDSVNPLLKSFFSQANVKNNAAVFVPLCGKTGDLTWLHEQGYQVTGIELSQLAIQEYFHDRGVKPQVAQYGAFTEYSMPNLRLLHGDFFALSKTLLGPVSFVYDRASMIALPVDMRAKYVEQLKKQCQGATLLLLTYSFETDPERGPPFSINEQQALEAYPKVTNLYNEPTTDERFIQRGGREHVFLAKL